MCVHIYIHIRIHKSLNNLHLQNISILPNSKVHVFTKMKSARQKKYPWTVNSKAVRATQVKHSREWWQVRASSFFSVSYSLDLRHVILSTWDFEIVLLRHLIVSTQQRPQLLSLDLGFLSGGQICRSWMSTYLFSEHFTT